MTAKPGFLRRPAPIAALNAVGRRLARSGIGESLNVDTMLASAKRRAGLSNFGDEWFMVPLRILVDSINEQAELTPVGRVVEHQRIVAALVNRLRVEELLRRRPEIHDRDLGRTILVAGMPRTGTTLLHRLLASNPDVRSLSGWEALSPVPLPGETRDGQWRRLRFAKATERVLGYLAPTLFAIHPIEHDAPEEDILILDLSFMSQTFEATMRVPAYSRWLEQQDQRRPYEYLRTVLKILAWQRPAGVWVLKTPQHLEHLDVVLKVLPKTTVVQTRRDPTVALASFCSLVANARGMLSDHVDPEEIAAHWSRKVHLMVERAMRVRQEAGGHRFVDVSYYDLVDDPVRELRRISERVGLEFGPAAVVAAESANVRNRRYRFGRHAYDPDDFGISRECVDRRFARYRAKFDIPPEATATEGGS